MTNSSSFFHTRQNPEVAGLSATLHHIGGWPVLSITGSPQTLELQFVNRTPHPVTAGPAQLRLVFRPGILIATEKLALAPQSEAQWALAVKHEKKEKHVILALSGVEQSTLEPGEVATIRIDGFAAAPEGGSRATRVEFSYAAFYHEDGAEVAGTRLIHLPVLRRHEPAGLPTTELRTGSTATSGPFLAGFVNGADVFNDGRSAGSLKIRIINVSRHPVALSSRGDEATRFYLSFQTGREDAEWGLLGSDSDHLSIEKVSTGWQVDHHTIRRTASTPLKPREWLEIEIDIHTKALTGQAQIVLTYENLPQHDDGDIVLLANLGPVARRDGKVLVDGDLEVGGVIKSDANYFDTGSETFTIGGDRGKFYPVVFHDRDWGKGEFRFEVYRSSTHGGGTRWRGSLMAKVACHSDNWGHGSGYWSIEVRQGGLRTGSPRFIGGFANHYRGAYHAIWLEGQATYSWHANHRARIVNLDDLFEPRKAQVGAGRGASTFEVKTELDEGFDADWFSLEKTAGRDTGPMPRGAIIMWSGAVNDIPVGWALCDGQNDTPDLRGRFLVGQGKDHYRGKNDPNRDAFNFPKGQTGGRSKVTLKVPQLPIHQHSGTTGIETPFETKIVHSSYSFKTGTASDAIGTSHKFYNHSKKSATITYVKPNKNHWHSFQTDYTGEGHPHENLPPYFALCFIIKL